MCLNSNCCSCTRMNARMCAKLRLTLCNPMDCSLPGSSVHGISQARSGLPCPPLGDFPGPGIEPTSLRSPALAGGSFTTSPTWQTRWTHMSSTGRHVFKVSGRGGLACCSSWGRRESDMTEWLNWTQCQWWWRRVNVLTSWWQECWNFPVSDLLIRRLSVLFRNV